MPGRNAAPDGPVDVYVAPIGDRVFLFDRTPGLPTPEQALRGRAAPVFTVPDRHAGGEQYSGVSNPSKGRHAL